MADRRAAWRAEVAPALDPDRLVFLDETSAKTNLARTHGYAPRGDRLVEAVPHGHWHTTTFVGGLRADGFVAPVVVDGAVNGDLFRAYVEQHLAPALRPGDVVVMDNLGSHKVAGVRAAIEGAGGRLLYLPPYSPDLNPIENAFSKLKRLLRAAARADGRGAVAADRPAARPVRPGRVPELLPALRVRRYTRLKSALNGWIHALPPLQHRRQREPRQPAERRPDHRPDRDHEPLRHVAPDAAPRRLAVLQVEPPAERRRDRPEQHPGDDHAVEHAGRQPRTPVPRRRPVFIPHSAFRTPHFLRLRRTPGPASGGVGGGRGGRDRRRVGLRHRLRLLILPKVRDRHPGHDLLDLLPVELLVQQEGLGDPVELLAVRPHQPGRPLLRVRQDPLDLLVDQPGRPLAERPALDDLLAEEGRGPRPAGSRPGRAGRSSRAG